MANYEHSANENSPDIFVWGGLIVIRPSSSSFIFLLQFRYIYIYNGFLVFGRGREIMSFNSTRFIQYPGCQCSGRKKPSLHLGGLAAAVSDVKVGSRSHTAARLLYARRKNGGFWSRLRASRSSLGAAKRPSWVRVLLLLYNINSSNAETINGGN